MKTLDLSEVAGSPVNTVLDSSTNEEYLIVRVASLGDLPSEVLDRLRTLEGATDESFRTRDAYPLIEKVALREGWGDPAMDIYEQYRDK